MKRDYLKFVVLFIAATQICFIKRANADIEEDAWMDPDAWARDYSSPGSLQAMGKCCKCSEDITELDDLKHSNTGKQKISAEDSASLIYYKKFIAMLFNPKNLEYDSTTQLYEGEIIFTVESSQLEKLKQLQDPRDLDNLLVEIFNNVRTPNKYRDGQKHLLHATGASSCFKALTFEIFYDIWQLTNTSEIKFLLALIVVILVARMLNNRFHIGWLSLIFGGIFIYGYLHTYLECNRELEANQMIKLLNRNKEIERDSKFVKFLKGIFSSNNPQDELQEKIKKSAKLSLGFCRPDHVLIKYFNDIFLTYIQTLLEQCTTTLTTLNINLGFPYNILSGVLLICVIGYVLNLTFKYILSPSTWMQLMHRKDPYQANLEAIKSRSNSQGDRISGDNLKMLLSAISSSSQGVNNAPKQQIAASVSGVEEVKEAIEPPPDKSSPQLDKSASVKSQNNNNSNGEPTEKITDVTLEDLSEES